MGGRKNQKRKKMEADPARLQELGAERLAWEIVVGSHGVKVRACPVIRFIPLLQPSRHLFGPTLYIFNLLGPSREPFF